MLDITRQDPGHREKCAWHRVLAPETAALSGSTGAEAWSRPRGASPRLSPSGRLRSRAAGLRIPLDGRTSGFSARHVGVPLPRHPAPAGAPTTPVFDAFAWLSFLAGKTERIRLGTSVYLLGLRHPFTAARAIQTLDVVSVGRAEIGLGAGWLREEWMAAGLDPSTRGRRLDEGLAVCKRLWVEPVIEHHGEFFDFGPVAFEPKTVQKPWPPIHIGGESLSALRRAADQGDGWLGVFHTPESIEAPLARIRGLRRERGRDGEPFVVTTGGRITCCEDLRRWEKAGVDRVIVTPWVHSRDAVDSLRRLAAIAFGRSYEPQNKR